MNEINCNSFVLDNGLAAVSAITREDRVLATDGFNRHFHFFDRFGNSCGKESSQRPYRKLRYDVQSDTYTALGCCSRADIFCIDSNLNENGYVSLSTAQNNSDCQNNVNCNFRNNTSNSCNGNCNCNCGCNCLSNSENTNCSELADASIARIGGECFLVGTFAKNAYLFDINGKNPTKLCTADRDERLTDFIVFGEEKYAMSTIKNGLRTIAVSENGITQNGILNRNLSLRMLFANDQTVYGLFGQNYIYNRIIPIYSNGILTLPDADRSCFCTC